MSITLEQTRTILKRVVEEAGPEKFANCYYSHEGLELLRQPGNVVQHPTCPDAENPLCVVGHVVKELLGVEGLRKLREGLSVSDQQEIFIEDLGFEPEAVRYLQTAQEAQDEDRSWYVAYSAAESELDTLNHLRGA